MNPAITRNPHKKIKHNKPIITQTIHKAAEMPTETLKEALEKIEPPEEILTDVKQPALNADEKEVFANDFTEKLTENLKSDTQVEEKVTNLQDNVEDDVKKPKVKKALESHKNKGKPGRKSK